MHSPFRSFTRFPVTGVQAPSQLRFFKTSAAHGPRDPEALYFHNSQAEIEWYPNSYIFVRWKANEMNSVDFRAVFQYIQGLLQITQTSLLLADHREMRPPLPADITWLMQEWTPTVVRETNYSHRAVIPARNPLTRERMTHVTGCEASAALTMRVFGEVDSAAQWLRSIYI